MKYVETSRTGMKIFTLAWCDKSGGTSVENAISSVSDNSPPSNNVDLSVCYTRTEQSTAVASISNNYCLKLLK